MLIEFFSVEYGMEPGHGKNSETVGECVSSSCKNFINILRLLDLLYISALLIQLPFRGLFIVYNTV